MKKIVFQPYEGDPMVTRVVDPTLEDESEWNRAIEAAARVCDGDRADSEMRAYGAHYASEIRKLKRAAAGSDERPTGEKNDG